MNHLVTVDQDRNPVLAGQLDDLGSPIPGHRNPTGLEYDTVSLQAAGDLPAGTDPVRRSPAPEQEDARPVLPVICFATHPGNRNRRTRTERFV